MECKVQVIYTLHYLYLYLTLRTEGGLGWVDKTERKGKERRNEMERGEKDGNTSPPSSLPPSTPFLSGERGEMMRKKEGLELDSIPGGGLNEGIFFSESVSIDIPNFLIKLDSLGKVS